MSELGPKRIGSYDVVRELGRGGQGVVYLARDERLGRLVALKVLTGFGAADPDVLSRFAREAQVSARLDHPNVCTVYEVGEVEGAPFIAMQFVEGVSLAERIRDSKNIGEPSLGSFFDFGDDEETVVVKDDEPAGTSSVTTRADLNLTYALIEKVAHALHHAHEKGVIHRDMKPGNIMVDERNEPIVLDFGLAGDLESDHVLTMTGDVFGTPAYMAPEQVLGKTESIDRRADVWALGVVLYESVTMTRPFDAPTRARLMDNILKRDPEDPRKLNRNVPSDLRVVLETALAKNPNQRYQSAQDLAEDLRRLGNREPVLARPVSPLTRTGRWMQRNVAVASLLCTILVLLVSTVVITLIKNRDLKDANQRTKNESDRAVRASEGLVEETKQKNEARLREQIANSERDRIAKEKQVSDRVGRSSELMGEALVQAERDVPLAMLLALESHGILPTKLSRQVVGSLVDKLNVQRVLRIPGKESMRVTEIHLILKAGVPSFVVASAETKGVKKSRTREWSFDIREGALDYATPVDLRERSLFVDSDQDKRLRWTRLDLGRKEKGKRIQFAHQCTVKNENGDEVRLLARQGFERRLSDWRVLIGENPTISPFAVVRGGNLIRMTDAKGNKSEKSGGTLELRDPTKQEIATNVRGEPTNFMHSALIKSLPFKGEMTKADVHPDGDLAAVVTRDSREEGASTRAFWMSDSQSGSFILSAKQTRYLRYVNSSILCCGSKKRPRFLISTKGEEQWLLDQSGKPLWHLAVDRAITHRIDAAFFACILPPMNGPSGITPRRLEVRSTADGHMIRSMNLDLLETDRTYVANKKIILISRRGEVEVADPVLGETLGVILEHDSSIEAIDIVGDWGASASNSGQVFIWSLNSKTIRHPGAFGGRPIIGPVYGISPVEKSGPQFVAGQLGVFALHNEDAAKPAWRNLLKGSLGVHKLVTNKSGSRTVAWRSSFSIKQDWGLFEIVSVNGKHIAKDLGALNTKSMPNFDRQMFLGHSGSPELFCREPFFVGEDRIVHVAQDDVIYVTDLASGTRTPVEKPGKYYFPVAGIGQKIILEDSFSGRVAVGEAGQKLRIIGRDLETDIRTTGGLSGNKLLYVRAEVDELVWYSTQSGERIDALVLSKVNQGAYDCVTDQLGETVALKFTDRIMVYKRGNIDPILSTPITSSVLLLNPTGTRMVGLSHKHSQIHFWDLTSGTEMARTSEGDESRKANFFEFSDSGRYLLVRQPTKHFQVWDMQTMGVVVTTADLAVSPNFARIGKHERYLVLGLVDGRILERPIDRINEARSVLPRLFNLSELVRFGFVNEDQASEFRAVMTEDKFINPDTGHLLESPMEWPTQLKALFIRKRDEVLAAKPLSAWNELWTDYEFAQDEADQEIAAHPLGLRQLLDAYDRTKQNLPAFRRFLDEQSGLNPGIRASFLAHKEAGIRRR